MMLALLAGLVAAAVVWLVGAFADGLLQTLATGVVLVGLGVGGWTALTWATRDDSRYSDERRAPVDARPERLIRLERLLAEAADSAAVEHQRLRPLLQSVAAERITALHGFRLDEDPERAAALLGDQAWELLRPDRPPPPDRRTPGRGMAELTAIVAAIEGES